VQDDLYPTRLKWDGRKGCARFSGAGGPLTAKPVVPGLPEWVCLDYVPGEIAALMPYAGPWRDLEAHEIAAVLRFLGRLPMTPAAGYLRGVSI
jgi:hypothetical protein